MHAGPSESTILRNMLNNLLQALDTKCEQALEYAGSKWHYCTTHKAHYPDKEDCPVGRYAAELKKRHG